MSAEKLMPLAQALHILSEVHTRDDDLTGFVVMAGAAPEYNSHWSRADYIQAWRSVRHSIGKEYDPEVLPTERQLYDATR